MEQSSQVECVQVGELPLEAWCGAMSFVLRSSHCLAQVSAVSRLFRDVSGEILSWQGSSVCTGPSDLELCDGRHHFEKLVPKWMCCERLFVNFKDCHIGARKAAARQCFQMMASRCSEVSGLTMRNWFLFENQGLPVLRDAFPKLRHLELNGCDQISNYAALVPIFEEHPTLLSLRASFQPKAVAGTDFASAAPRTLTTLGFVNFDTAETVAILLERCSLEHLWFSANSDFALVVRRAGGLARLASAVQNSMEQVRTLALPSSLPEDLCAALVKTLCPKLELLCRMRIGSPAFGTGALADHFEEVAGAGGVVLRRRGTTAGLAVNGALWAPYAQDDSGVVTSSPSQDAQALKKREWTPGRQPDARWSVRQSCASGWQSELAFASEIAVAAAARRR